MNRSSYSATDELSLCQDRITSIFSLIKRNFKKIWKQTLKRILNVLGAHPECVQQFNYTIFFFAGKRKLISFQQLTFWHLIKSLHDLWIVLFNKAGMGLC